MSVGGRATVSSAASHQRIKVQPCSGKGLLERGAMARQLDLGLGHQSDEGMCHAFAPDRKTVAEMMCPGRHAPSVSEEQVGLLWPSAWMLLSGNAWLCPEGERGDGGTVQSRGRV